MAKRNLTKKTNEEMEENLLNQERRNTRSSAKRQPAVPAAPTTACSSPTGKRATRNSSKNGSVAVETPSPPRKRSTKGSSKPKNVVPKQKIERTDIETESAGYLEAVVPVDADASAVSTIDLSTVPDLNLIQIFKKFNCFKIGTRFRRSCRRARNLVDKVKPVWPVNQVEYGMNDQCVWFLDGEHIEDWPQNAFEFCRIKRLVPDDCNDNFFIGRVLPEISKMAAVEHLSMHCLSEDQVRQLMGAVKPTSVEISYHLELVASGVFQHVQRLHFIAADIVIIRQYWKTKRIFELARNQTVFSWSFINHYEEAILSFLENWLKGESTGSLQELNYSCNLPPRDPKEVVEEILNKEDIKNIMKRYVKKRDGFYLERDGRNHVYISFSDGYGSHGIHFLFFVSNNQ